MLHIKHSRREQLNLNYADSLIRQIVHNTQIITSVGLGNCRQIAIYQHQSKRP